MAYAHQALSEEELGPAVLKVIGEAAPPPMRMMAARGLAPLPPRDLVVALYQLWATNAPKLADEAAKTAVGLPAQVLGGALGDRDLHPGVIDFLSRKLLRDEGLIEKIVRHPRVDDQTLIGVARVCPEGICEVLAENQVRWIAAPQIVVSLYYNRNCRMSTVQRMLEFAEREGVEIKLPNMEEIRAAMKEVGAADPTRDHLFKSTLSSDTQDEEIARMMEADPTRDVEEVMAELEGGGDAEADARDAAEAERLANQLVGSEGEAGEDEGEAGEAPEEASPTSPEDIVASRQSRMQQIMQMNPMEKIRAALLGDAYDRSLLVRDANKVVSLSAIKSPKIKESEVVALSANRALSHDVIRYIANKREWVKMYTVKLNLVMNPKTPLSRSMSLLTFLSASDIKKVARSKNVPGPLAKAAQRKQRETR